MANFLLKFRNFRYHGNRGWCDTNFVCTVKFLLIVGARAADRFSGGLIDPQQHISSPRITLTIYCEEFHHVGINMVYKCKKLYSLKHLVRTTVAGSHN